MNYFMYNRNIKRIVFLTLSCERPGMVPISPSTTPSLPSSFASRTGLTDSSTPAMDEPFGYHNTIEDDDDDDDRMD